MKVHFDSMVEADSIQEALNILKESIDEFTEEKNIKDKFIIKFKEDLEFSLVDCWNTEKLTLEAYIERVKGNKNEFN